MFNQTITTQFKRVYDVENIGYTNMHDVYSSHKSGFGSMARMRAHLLKRGMTAQFADILAAKHIKNLEEGKIVTIMDLFS